MESALLELVPPEYRDRKLQQIQKQFAAFAGDGGRMDYSGFLEFCLTFELLELAQVPKFFNATKRDGGRNWISW